MNDTKVLIPVLVLSILLLNLKIATSDSSIMLKDLDLFENVLCTRTERMFWKFAWNYFKGKNFVRILATKDTSLPFSEEIFKCSQDNINMTQDILIHEWNETHVSGEVSVFKNRTTYGLVFATQWAEYSEIRINLVAQTDQTTKFIMILTDTDSEQVERILKLCWHKYNMLNVAIFYNFDKLSDEYYFGMNESFTLSFYDPFAPNSTDRGLVHEFRIEDNDSFIQEIITMMNGRLRDVRQHPLRICIVESNGTAFPIHHPNGTLSRYILRDGNIMHSLVNFMNFRPIYYAPEDGQGFGKIYANGTRTGCLDELEHGKADILGNMSPIMDLGQQNSEFITAIEEYKFAFITPYRPPKFVVTFFNIFSLNFYLVWIAVYILILGTWLFMQKTMSSCHSKKLTLAEVVLITFGISMNVSQPVVKPLYARLLFITWALFSLVNGYIYGGTMLEHLTGGRISMNLQRMRQLKNNNLKVLVFHRFKNFLKDMAESDAAPDYYKDLYRRQEVVNNTEEALERIAKRKDAVLMYTLLLANVQKLRSQYKEHLHVLNSGPPSWYSSHLVPTVSPYKPMFDQVYQRITESGLMPKWTDDVLQWTTKRIKMESSEKLRAGDTYTMRELGFIFESYLACCALSCIVFGIEIFIHFKKTRRQIGLCGDYSLMIQEFE